MDTLKRYASLFLSSVLGIAVAGGYAALTFHDTKQMSAGLTRSQAEWVNLQATLELCLLFFATLYFSGRGFALLFRSRSLAAEIKHLGNWHLKLLTAGLALTALTRFWFINARGWQRFDDLFTLAVLGGFLVLAVIWHLGPDAKISFPGKGRLFPGEVRDVPEPIPDADQKIAIYGSSPRVVDNLLHNRLYLLRRHVGGEAERWVVGNRPSRWKLPLAAAAAVLVGTALGAFHPALTLLGLPGLGLAGYAIFQHRRLPQTLNQEINMLGSRGTLVLANIAKANSVLFEPGDLIAPAMVLFSTHPNRRLDEVYLREVRGKIHELDRQAAAPSEALRPVWEAMRDDYSLGPVAVPSSLCGEANTWLCHILINPLQFPGNKVSDRAFPCIVDLTPKKYLRGPIIHL